MTEAGRAGVGAVTVLVCGAVDAVPTSRALAEARLRLGAAEVRAVGARPGKEVDPLLRGALVVVGDDADLAAVVLRLVRRELLGKVTVAYLPGSPTPFTRLWGLGSAGPVGSRERPVPVIRDDAGGVLIAAGSLSPVDGPVYVDDKRVLGGPAHEVRVAPDPARGLAVTITVHPRRVPLVGRRPVTTLGRAVQIGTTETTVVRDGVPYPRPMTRWTWYRHTADLRLLVP